MSSTTSDGYVVFTPGTKSEFSELASDADSKLSLYSGTTMLTSDLGLDLQPLEKNNAVLISTQQPRIPNSELEHAPCDIVLVIDVSGSMGASAPLPDAGANEESGLTVLDLCKHATRTVIETLGERDRLGIVVFDSQVKVVQGLNYMTTEQKKTTLEKVKALRPGNATNLWGGLRKGLNLFTEAKYCNNVQGLFVLTDGMPNYMCPEQGYVPKLKPILESMSMKKSRFRSAKQLCIPSIHTFGFGYSIRSGLMQSIAETGGGSYAFIPDAGMIGTVFVHAIANLFSTYATSAKLTLETIADAKLQYVGGMPSIANEEADQLTLDLGNLQFGQSRDVIIHIQGNKPGIIVNAKLTCLLPDGSPKVAKSSITLSGSSSGRIPAPAQYHLYRDQLTSTLATLFPIRADGEHVPNDMQELDEMGQKFSKLASVMRNSPFASDPDIKSLCDDINGPDPAGQVLLAMATKDGTSYWQRWGQHYLPSLLHAHMRQMCNTFKDPGPLRYGADSPLFLKYREKLDAVFEDLPPPEPTPNARGHVGPAFTGSMRRYHCSNNPCFEGESLVRCADGKLQPVKQLRTGQSVWTPAGNRKVRAILRTNCSLEEPLCRVGHLWITPWHPIKQNGTWVHPAEVSDEVMAGTTSVYSLLLEVDSDESAHAIEVGGQVAVTLGHGLLPKGVETGRDIRAHQFFGDYGRVLKSLETLNQDAQGHYQCGGLGRRKSTNLVCGFARDVSNSTPTEVHAML